MSNSGSTSESEEQDTGKTATPSGKTTKDSSDAESNVDWGGPASGDDEPAITIENQQDDKVQRNSRRITRQANTKKHAKHVCLLPQKDSQFYNKSEITALDPDSRSRSKSRSSSSRSRSEKCRSRPRLTPSSWTHGLSC